VNLRLKLVVTPRELDLPARDAVQDAAWEMGLAHGRCVQLAIRSHDRSSHGIDQARLKSDYGDIAPASRSEAERAIAEAEKIVAVLTPLASHPPDRGG
jgi:hypothetical protein